MTWAIREKSYSQRRACRLVGLHPKTYRYGIRKNDGGAQMSDLVQRLDERDIAAVAAYYQQVKSALPASAAPAK